jgi:hypothetical protein
VEEAGEWVIFPGEAPNMPLQLLHANEWFGNHNSGAAGRLEAQGSVKPYAQRPKAQWHSLCRTDVIPSKRPKTEPAGGAPDTSLEESDLPDQRGEPQARHNKTPRRHVRENVAEHVRVGAVRQNDRYSCNQCENQCEQNRCAKERYLPAIDANSVANGFLHRQREGGIEVVT